MANELFRKQLPFANRDPIGSAAPSATAHCAAGIKDRLRLPGGLCGIRGLSGSRTEEPEHWTAQRGGGRRYWRGRPPHAPDILETCGRRDRNLTLWFPWAPSMTALRRYSLKRGAKPIYRLRNYASMNFGQTAAFRSEIADLATIARRNLSNCCKSHVRAKGPLDPRPSFHLVGSPSRRNDTPAHMITRELLGTDKRQHI